jgi:hypothetical protein
MGQLETHDKFVMPKNAMSELSFFGDVDGTTWTPEIPRLDYKESRAILPRLVRENKITTAFLKNTRLFSYRNELMVLVALPIECVRVSNQMNNLDIKILCEVLSTTASTVKQVIFEGSIDEYAANQIQMMTININSMDQEIKVTYKEIGTSKQQ